MFDRGSDFQSWGRKEIPFKQTVCDIQHRNVQDTKNLVQTFEQRFPLCQIHGRQGFIQQQRHRLWNQRASQRNPLPLTPDNSCGFRFSSVSICKSAAISWTRFVRSVG